ncbi:MAG: hypothetical protein JOS17DRAFT_794814 [Linnemannia elongata]|nr:MAG: hypothetical protein JOS17DRAFT_794814 [Linnemannia elongata]
MPSSSCRTIFFSLPELLTTLVSHLPREDLLRLSRTNRILYKICAAQFWRDLLLYGQKNCAPRDIQCQDHLLNSPEALQALVRNIDNIRSVVWMADFTWYFPGPYAGYCGERHLHHTFWLLHLNRSTLVCLQLDHADLMHPRALRDLCRTLSGLFQLKTFRLVEISLTQVLHLDAQEDEWDYGLGPLVLRDVAQPLHQLEILQLPDTTRRFETVRLCRILAHCPALKPFRVPFLRDSKDVRAIANLFGKACSGITTLTMYDPSPRSGYDATLTFIETFPAQQLQELKYYYYQDRYPERTSAGWFRHSESLRSIELFLTSAIRGNTLHRILTSFPALERLIVNDLQFPVQTRTSRRRRRTMGLHANPNSGAYSPDAHWDMLDKFYTQIGSLPELTNLTLRAAEKATSILELPRL